MRGYSNEGPEKEWPRKEKGWGERKRRQKRQDWTTSLPKAAEPGACEGQSIEKGAEKRGLAKGSEAGNLRRATPDTQEKRSKETEVAPA